MTNRRFLVIVPLLLLTGCGLATGHSSLPESLGERASAHGYVPLDPLPVDQIPSDSCREIGDQPSGNVLYDLPDLTIRFAIAEFSAGGSLAFGPFKATAENGNYRAVLDYINADNVPVDFYVRRRLAPLENPPAGLQDNEIWYPQGTLLAEEVPEGKRIVAYEAKISPFFIADEVRRLKENKRKVPIEFQPYENPDYVKDRHGEWINSGYSEVTIPIYVGVGLRLSADIIALKGGVSLSGLGAIGAQAEANNLSGTLTVQTLGFNGKAAATSLPLPNKLDQTTIENAILAIGTNRALMFSEEADTNDVKIKTRVVGLYSPIGTDPLLINAIYSELSRIRPKWPRPCSE